MDAVLLNDDCVYTVYVGLCKDCNLLNLLSKPVYCFLYCYLLLHVLSYQSIVNKDYYNLNCLRKHL